VNESGEFVHGAVTDTEEKYRLDIRPNHFAVAASISQRRSRRAAGRRGTMRRTVTSSLQTLGGWKTLSMVTRYAHACTENYREGIKALPSLFGEKSGILPNTELEAS
jgi:hypothetical protein